MNSTTPENDMRFTSIFNCPPDPYENPLTVRNDASAHEWRWVAAKQLFAVNRRKAWCDAVLAEAEARMKGAK